MAEYIDRHALKNDGHICWHDGKGNVFYEVDHAPIADVVEVVRCKDCRHAFFRYNNDRYPFGIYACRKQPSGRAYKKVRGDFWCAYGEKMDGKE